jgi:hypothetical protein
MRLALVRRDGEILEGDSGLQERLLLLRDAAEIECGAFDRLRPQQVAKRGHMGALDSADDLHGACRAPRDLSDTFGLGVERGLQVLERERIVENRDVTLRQRRSGRRRGRSERGRSPRSNSQEPPAGNSRGGFAQRAVTVELIQVEVEIGGKLGDHPPAFTNFVRAIARRT